MLLWFEMGGVNIGVNLSIGSGITQSFYVVLWKGTWFLYGLVMVVGLVMDGWTYFDWSWLYTYPRVLGYTYMLSCYKFRIYST